jgi:N-succinyldiaminopimelate aminotransferase
MNRHLGRLLPYPFERLRTLLADTCPPPQTPIPLHIGEPRHAPPDFVVAALRENLTDSLGRYPTSAGQPELRTAIARWLTTRYALPDGAIDPATTVIPVSGTREALFSFGQAALDPASDTLVAMPNPGYQVYEGTALIAGATPLYLACAAATGFLPDLDSVSAGEWNRCQLLFLCSPGNPTGTVLPGDYLAHALALADRFGFVLASDECYSEIYDDEQAPPPGLLGAAFRKGHTRFDRCVVFHSLSKRSNLPGLRSGFVAGDPTLLAPYARYRSYHGCAMPVAVQRASQVAWQDERHVIDNRALYRAKFDAVVPILAEAFDVVRPAAGFYIWLDVRGDDEQFTRELFAASHVTVLPGSYLSRDVRGHNPGAGRVRISLIASHAACVDAARRIVAFAQAHAGGGTAHPGSQAT